MKLKIMLLFIFCITLNAKSQISINSAGGDETSFENSFSYSVGQITYSTFTDGTLTFNEGIQVNLPIIISNINKNDYQIDCFVTLEFNNIVLNLTDLSLNLIYCLYDINGKIIEQNQIVNNKTNIKIQNNNLYFISIIYSNKVLKTFKIIKT